MSVVRINFEGLNIQFCQIQVDKFDVGLRPSVQGLNIRALKFQNLCAEFLCFSLFFQLQLARWLLSLQLFFGDLDCFSSPLLK